MLKLYEQSKRNSTTTIIRRDSRAGSGNIFTKPQEVDKKNKCGNPVSFNNSLVCHKKTLANNILQAPVVQAFKTDDKRRRQI